MSEHGYRLDDNANDGWQQLLMAVIQQAQEDWASRGTTKNVTKKQIRDTYESAKLLLFGKSLDRPNFGNIECLLVANGMPISFADGARSVARRLRKLHSGAGSFGPVDRVEAKGTGPIDWQYWNDSKAIKLTAKDKRRMRKAAKAKGK